MRRLMCVGAILVGLAGCASQADHLRVLERKEANLARAIAALEVESDELQTAVASVSIALIGMEESEKKAELEAQFPGYRDRTLAIVDEKLGKKAELEAELVEVSRRIADLVE